MTDLKRREVIAALRRNPNASLVVRQIGDISYGSVWSVARDAGINLESRGTPKIQSAKRAQVIAELRRNRNARAVARAIGGISHVSVSAIAKAEGIRLRAGRPARAPR